MKKINKTEDEWKKELTPEQYAVLRNKGTEAPGTGKYLHEKSNGTYACVACGNELFMSDSKFDSGTGWPSFDQAISGAIEEHDDSSNGTIRTEITCTQCRAHLGHVFPDGPTSTGNRYCLNSVCLDLKEAEQE